MNNTNWEKVQELFEQALEFSKEDRIPFLKKQCGSDKDLFKEVISLLEADDNVHPVLDRKASEIINIEEKLNFVGQQIGSYKIIEEIATGGMGTVFLAKRSDGFFDQKVALKIVKPGLSTIPIIRRFQHERQILANLHHPNIARLFDGGVTEDKRPFFTMEYVDGISIDEYCDQQKLVINERLNLFVKVCEAVQYAHNNLVIHRDLKPSNILIQKDGTIKLLDFGISKVLIAESENSDMPTVTQAEINLLTPEYSSPEQIRNSNISVSTDVYSLGLILYKLVSGKSAHEFRSHSFIEYEKVVCEQSIKKPSLTLVNETSKKDSSTQNLISNICKNRRTHLKKLKRTLSGDIDNICMMALRKEPERRYVSVEMLALDIQRYLDDLPILARNESLIYTTKKFIVRHKTAVTVAAVFFVIINTLVIYYTLQLRSERDKAQIEARKSEQVASFLQDLFLVSDPSESKGETITARELLDRGAVRLKGGLEDEPEIKSQLLNTIGKVYTNLGLFKSAEDILLNIKEHPNLERIDKKTYIESLINLGNLYRIKGKYELAGDILLKTLEICHESLGRDHPLFGDCYLSLGGYYYETGDFNKSHVYFDKAEQLFRKNYGYDHEKVAAVIHDLGVLEFDEGNLDKVDSLYRESLRIELKLKGEINSNVATYQNDLGQVLRHKGEFKEAQELYEKALSTRIKIFGKEHPDVAVTLNHFSRLYYNQDLFDEAEPFAREALRIRLVVFDQDHPEVSASRSSLAGVLMEKKKYKEAEDLFRLAYNSTLRKLGESHPYTPALLGNLGKSLLEQKKYKEAEGYLLKSINMFKKIFSLEHTYTLRRTVWLTDLYNRTTRFDEAEKLLREQLRALENKLLQKHWLTATAKSQLGYSLFKQSKYLEAEGLLVYGFNSLKEQKGKNNSETMKSLQRIVEFYKSKGRDDKVLEYSSQL